MPMALARTPLPKAGPPLVTWPPPPGASGYLWPVMMKRTTRALLSGALAIGLFGGCSSDLDVINPGRLGRLVLSEFFALAERGLASMNVAEGVG